MGRFRGELEELLRLTNVSGYNGLSRVLDTLDLEVSKGAIARYHALLQFIVALDLYRRGFDVSVEEHIDGGFKADVFAESPQGSIVVEVETGYVPVDKIRFLEEFLEAKVAFKAVAYSVYADLFIIATPSHVRLLVTPELVKPVGERDILDVMVIRELALKYDRAKASKIVWRAPMSRVDGLAYVNILNARVHYRILGREVNRELKRMLMKST